METDMLITGQEVVAKLKALERGQEAVVNGEVWLRIDPREFKVSPEGLKGDYDARASFVAARAVADEFNLTEKYQFDIVE